MAYDFWETMKKFLKGELKFGNDTNLPTLNPVDDFSNIQKAATLKNMTQGV